MDEYTAYLEKLHALERRQRRRALILPAVLFMGTMFTTLLAGALMQFITPEELMQDPHKIFRGVTFAAPLMLILLTHEMGHFTAGKIHRVRATLPYFIPFPNYIGTFGAVIKMKSPMHDRRALMDIGAAGPLAGFILSVIACAWGLLHLKAIPLSALPEWSYWNPRIVFGDNLTLIAMYKIFGIHLEPGMLYVNPILDAGWLGMFVTSLNLLPAGQLDGGHISYAMLGERKALWLARAVVGILLLLGVPGFHWTNTFWAGWTIWGILIMILGMKHPAPMNPAVQLDTRRKYIGVLCLIVFLISFTPMPFHIIE